MSVSAPPDHSDHTRRRTPQSTQIGPTLATVGRRRAAVCRARVSGSAARKYRRRSRESAARRSTGTSPTRSRCWSSCWWASHPPTRRRTRGPLARTDAAAALDGLIDFHLDFALGEADLIRIQDRDLAYLPATAERQVRRAQRPLRRGMGGRTARTRARTRRNRRTADGARRIRSADSPCRTA